MNGRIVVPASVLAAVRYAAVAAWPAECCGLLVGRMEEAVEGRGRVWHVHRAVPSPNVAAPRHAPQECNDRFEIDPRVLFDTIRTARTAGDALIGHYHSHPNGSSEPSAVDREAVHYPDHAWLIVAIADGTPGGVAAWWPDPAGKGFRPLVLEVASDGSPDP